MSIIGTKLDPVANQGTSGEAERRELLVDWSATHADYPKTCLHHLFEQQVKRTPSKIAAAFEDEQLTYEQLNTRANQIAHHLGQAGVRAESLVGVSVGRSLQMVTALLGVLKAGAGYVPLDPSYPKDRLGFMIEDAEIELLLSEKRLAQALPVQHAKVVCLDSDWPIISRQGRDNLRSSAQSENLAYVIYTSGSTGKPKGVQISHRALVNFLTSMQQWPGLTDEDILLAITTLSFDIAALEIFLPLVTGARLVIASREVSSDGARLADEIVRSGATVLQATPATWRMLLSAGWQGDGLLRMFCGGEAMSADLARQLLKRGGRLWNMYGPTETTIWSTVHEVRAGDEKILIGRPIDNTQIYLLDEQMRPVQPGVAAELHIGGIGLARGYLNRPELTAEKFLPDPFSGDDNTRLYKTGDLARCREDGALECLGRLDHQVKIRGFRIETEEIEAALRSCPAVADAVVVAREYGPGDKRLLAYLVLKSDSADESMVRELRSFLGDRLPDYMVPFAFVVLEKIPLTPSGKVDRKGLPLPLEAQSMRREPLMRPLDPLEHQLSEIWEDVFEQRPIGIRDDFFDLGGNSLLAARMMERVEDVCGRRLALDALYNGATIEHLASALMQQEGPAIQSPIVEIQKGDRRPPFFFLHGDFNGGGFYCRKLAGLLGKDQPFYALPPIGVDGQRVPSTIEEMAELHLRALRAFCPQGPYMLGGFCNGALVAFDIARRLEAEGQEVRLLAVVYASAINARYRLLKSMLNIYGRFNGLGDDERFDRFIRTRNRAMRLRESGRHHRERLVEAMHKGTGEQLALLIRGSRKLKRLAKRFLLESERRGEHTTEIFTEEIAETYSGEIAASRRTAARRKLTEAYNRVMDGYVPHSYKNRLILFWPTEAPPEEFDDPTMGWRRVARRVEVRPIAGAHLTCITRHVDVLAAQLRECLQEAIAGR